ncbi:autotransporter domain-containing protein [Sebaldella sp. S0638]|uniref:autotransporter domain-containing protein n=1 Tax=Sebaldella sp. S0638 TaxID=2957809 RepID=UPI00209CF447|nr:autotransporter domain-containing protein [Sebaldella sp. S0638]MCP1224737.1 autotransporter domain-containing protein [Sebaldella sp. S0638]
MLRNKKVCMFLALGSIANIYAENNNSISKGKYDRIYNNMTKNIGNKSSDENYKLLEKILNKRNKELKDLYMQSDYIVKPEYLEWQIYFSGFYNNNHRGGSKETAVSIEKGTAKSVDLGMYIPVKGIMREDVELNISPVDAPVVNVNMTPAAAPQITAPIFTVGDLSFPTVPNVAIPYFGVQNSFQGKSIGGITTLVRYNTSGNKIYENLNVESTAGTSLELNGATNNITVTGEAAYNNGSYTGTTASSYTHTGYTTGFSAHNISNSGNFEVKGNWDMSITDGKSYDNWGFLSYRPYYATTDSKVVFSGNLTLQANNTTNTFSSTALVGLSLNLGTSTANLGTKATLENTGTITLKDGTQQGQSGIAMQLDRGTATSSKEGELINSGNIIIESTSKNVSGSTGGVGVFVAVDPYTKPILIKSGNISITGNGNRAVEIGASVYGSYDYVNSSIEIDGSNGKIILEGDKNVGLYVQRGLSTTGTNILDSVRNMDILINGTNTPAVSRETQSATLKTMDMILNDTIIQKVEFGENSKQSSLVKVSYGNVILDSSLVNSIEPINAGFQNSIAAGSYATVIKNYMPVTINSGAKAMSVIVTNGTFENYGDIINNSSSYANEWGYNYGGLGLVITGMVAGEHGLNKGNITMNGDYATAIYNNGLNMTSENSFIEVNGKQPTAVYSGAGSLYVNGGYVNTSSETDITTDRLEINGDGGAAIFSKGGNVSLQSKTSGQAMEMTVNGKDSFAFFFQKFTNNGSSLTGKTVINGDVNVNLKNGAIGYYYEGSGIASEADLPEYINSITDTSNGKLTINADSDSFNIAVKNTKVNLSDLRDITESSSIEFNGLGRSKVTSSLLVIDIDSNIDKNNNTGDKTYRNTEIGKSGVSVSQGVTIKGTEDNLVGIGQSYNANEYNRISSENNGTIDLEGSNSIGIYTKRAGQTNTGILNLNGETGIGMYTTGGTARNDGEINIGNNGVGIYAESYPVPDDGSTSYSSFTVYNSGKITAASGEKAIGIYVNENSSGGTYGSGTLALEGGTDIDVSASKGGVGIYSNKSYIMSSGPIKITVGENGTGIYIKDNSVYSDNLELNLLGDNSVGVYTDGTASFMSSGTVNVDGKGIVIFNVAGSGTFNQNFSVNSTSDSQYIVQNIKDRTLYYDSSASLGDGGTFISGINSAVLLGNNSYISAAGNNMVGIALTGGYSGGIPVTINGETVYQEATNKGVINFSGDKSTAIYATNGASAKNEGTIYLGGSSVGLYGSGSGTSIENTGHIEIGAGSSGLYIKDGDNVSNYGTINSTGERSVCIYLDGSNNITGENNGVITLTGDKSVGVYITSDGAKTFNNRNSVEIGNSVSMSDPAIGIFNNNTQGTVNNSADIISGVNSIGIYSKGGEVNHTAGDVKVGLSGTGIYMNSGNLNITGGNLTLTGEKTVGIYGTNGAVIDNNAGISVSSDSYGVVLSKDSVYTGRNISNLEDKSVLVYSDGKTTVNNEAGADLNMAGSDSIGFYLINGGDITNKAVITGDNGTANIGIYNKAGSIDNSGDIKIGDSVIIDPENPFANKYSVGLYGENVQNMKNSGNITVGSNGVGFYSVSNINESLNTGNITSASEKAVGIYIEQGAVRNEGNITLSGDGSIGIAGTRNTEITNAGTITMNGNNSMGIYANANSKVINENTGKIYINGNNSTGIQLSGSSILENYGLIEIASGTIGSEQVVTGDAAYTPPSIINAGIIKVDEKFELDGFNLIIKPDSSSFRVPTMEEISLNGYSPDDINGGFLLSNSVSIVAPGFNFGDNDVKIDPLFTQGTNARVYKFENVFDPTTPEGGQNTGEVSVKSSSLTFDAIPVTNDQGKIDIWMEKIDYDNFTKGAWYDGFAKNIEDKYLNAQGDALKIYDKLDLITDENTLRDSFEQLSGSVYANINQREQDIYGVLNNALFTLQNSENNTKENVKINVIAGKGSTKENTSGVESYDYNTVGVLALREVERTYRHTFGYSLGYTRTDFQMKDTNNEDQADTVQLGLHNKYSVNGWNFRNDLLGRVSFHNNDRSIQWYDGTKSDMKSDYNVYGISSLNEIGKDIEIGRNVKLVPFTGLELGYMAHESFEETGGAESLNVESNDGYSIKPSIGLRLEAEKSLGSNSDWKIKGNIGAAYEYELGNMNRQEKASLSVIEEGYHKLAQTAEDKGKIKTGGTIGVELKDRYGIFLTGEYGAGNDNKEDYKVGVSFKAAF